MTWYKHAPRVLLGALLVASPVSGPMSAGQEPQKPMVFEGNPGGWKILEEGQPPAMVHATVEAMKKYREANPEAKPGGGGQASTSNDLYYHGGVGGIGVETAPKVYLVLWGSQWSSDPSGEAAILENFYRGAGGASWTNTVTQYCRAWPAGPSTATARAKRPAILQVFSRESGRTIQGPRRQSRASRKLRRKRLRLHSISGIRRPRATPAFSM